ncbi:hypothetical protein ACFL6I_08615 [candidate division KSB1 bacterium]
MPYRKQKIKDNFIALFDKMQYSNFSFELATEGSQLFIKISDMESGVADSIKFFAFLTKSFSQMILSGEISISKLFKTNSIGKFKSVSDFWVEVDNQRKEKNKYIEGDELNITGLLSPYGPLTPSHPMSKPGYSVEGWEAMGELDVEDAEDYDVQDAIIYGDRVIRIPYATNKIYYGGLYDILYGISNISLPIFIEESFIKNEKYELHNLWKEKYSPGRCVEIKGQLLEIKKPYSEIIPEMPKKYTTLPNYGLYVKDIKYSSNPYGVTHIATSVAWLNKDLEERMLTHYFNVQNKSQFRMAEGLLQEQREEHKNTLFFDYDSTKYLSKKKQKDTPILNEILHEILFSI